MTVLVAGSVAFGLVVAWVAAVVALRHRLPMPAWTSATIGWPSPTIAWPRRVDPVDVGAALVTALLLVMVAAGAAGPLRILVALAFVSFVPGWALLAMVPPLKLATFEPRFRVVGTRPLVVGVPRIALAVVLSLTICTGSAQALLWLRAWAPAGLLAVLGGLSLALLAAHMVLAEPEYDSDEGR